MQSHAYPHPFTRAVGKFVDSRYYFELELLGRCGEGLFFEVPTLSRNTFHTTLQPPLENDANLLP
jgi:hypothetical protein